MPAHPDAMQRVGDELIRTVWPGDRKFFRDHPGRSYRLRPAQPVEIAQEELCANTAVTLPPGAIALIAIRQVRPGLRLRTLIVVEDPPGPLPPDLPEEVCRDWYHRHTSPAAEEGAATSPKALTHPSLRNMEQGQ